MQEAATVNDDTLTQIRSAADIVTARQRARAQAIELGFSGTDVTLVTAAISEVARNIVDHAKEGELTMRIVEIQSRRGLQIVACDRGPGIADVAQAMQYGYSTRRGLGVGLPGAKWLMDEFEINSSVGVGTTVTMTKWLPERAESALVQTDYSAQSFRSVA
jgi:serine/threonine-protein kinase RsbT